jgi:hypothetical protein
MKHKSLRFYSALTLVLVLLAALPALVKAKGEDQSYYAMVTGYGERFEEGHLSTCRVTIMYKNQNSGGTSHLYVEQIGDGPAGCPSVNIHLEGDDVPLDLVDFKGKVYGWLADGYFDLAFDGLVWSFDITTSETREAQGLVKSYPSGDVSSYESRHNIFNVNSFEIPGATYDYDSYSGWGFIRKYE